MSKTKHDVPAAVQQMIENHDSGSDDPDIHEAECRDCGTRLFDIDFEPNSNTVNNEYVDEYGDANFWYAAEDTYSDFYLPAGTDAENPFVCEPCRDDVHLRSGQGGEHRCVIDGQIAAVEVQEGYVLAELPWVETDIDDWDNPLHDQRNAVLCGDTENLEFEGEPLVEIDLRPQVEDRLIEGGVEGVTGVLNSGVGYFTPGSADRIDELEAQLYD